MAHRSIPIGRTRRTETCANVMVRAGFLTKGHAGCSLHSSSERSLAMRGASRHSRIGAALCGLLLISPVSAQQQVRPSEEAIASKLAGDERRDWIKVRESVFMGGSKCQAGERWRFTRQGTLTVRTCRQERWQVSTHRWRLEPDGSLDYRLVISPALQVNGRRIRFRGVDQFLILRRMPNAKTTAVHDVELRRASGPAPVF
jgi:hypothetical protein